MTTTTEIEYALTPSESRVRKMYIGGAWVDAVSGETIDSVNPATGEVLASVPRGRAEDVDRAVIAARRAFEGPWSRFKPVQRQQLLLDLADLFDKHWDELSLTDTLDMGKPLARTRADKARVTGMLRYYAGMAMNLDGRTIKNSQPGDLLSYTSREPVGVVGAIIPWNAPIAASIWKIGPALATGCTVVLKPSEEAPLSPLLIAELMDRAGFPRALSMLLRATESRLVRPLPSTSASTRSRSPGQRKPVRASSGRRRATSRGYRSNSAVSRL
ncbi:hypothetical protein GCM10020255_013410 [Rhodococcus baikonurensis]